MHPESTSASATVLPSEPYHLSSHGGSATTDADGSAAGRAAYSGRLRIAAFFVVFALSAFGLDGLIDLSLRRISNGEFGVWNRIVEGRVNADVLVSGSSRALTHYDPRMLQLAAGRSAYNIGLNGSQTDMQLARLKAYLRHNRKPSVLIHNLDAFSFQVTHGGVYDPGQYVPYLDEPSLYSALAAINPDVWKSRYVPLYGYAAEDLRFSWLRGVRDLLTGGRADTHVDGFKPRHSQWTGDFERFRASNPNGVSVEVEAEGIRQMEEMLELCAQHGIKVVLSYSPEYRPVQEMTVNRAEIFARFESMSRRYGAVFLDFSDSPISSRQEYFYNSQHLNAEGAAAFTRELVQRLADAGVIAGVSGSER